MAGAETEKFNYEQFASMLSEQASTLVPSDFPNEIKDMIIKIVYNFCYMAGEAISQDDKLNFTPDQCAIVTQFIGEWSFHKSIDILRSNLPKNVRDSILQKIAFTVFEISKQAIINNLPQDDMIKLVEAHVTKIYKESLTEYTNKGVITKKQFEFAIKQSNLDVMAQTNDPEVIKHIEEHTPKPQVKQQNQSQQSSKHQQTNTTTKVLKLATLALILRQMPHDKISSIISKFNEEEANALIQYVNTPDLESKIDKQVLIKCLKEIKTSIPTSIATNPKLLYKKIHKLVNTTDKNKMLAIVKNERSNIKEFVLGMYDNMQTPMPARVQEIIYQHLEEKTK